MLHVWLHLHFTMAFQWFYIKVGIKTVPLLYLATKVYIWLR
jgi:hypothetical protein